MNFSIEPYETENGRKPAIEFLDSLDKAHKQKIANNIVYLKLKGNMLGMPLSRPLEDGIFELKSQFLKMVFREFVISLFMAEKSY